MWERIPFTSSKWVSNALTMTSGVVTWAHIAISKKRITLPGLEERRLARQALMIETVDTVDDDAETTERRALLRRVIACERPRRLKPDGSFDEPEEPNKCP